MPLLCLLALAGVIGCNDVNGQDPHDAGPGESATSQDDGATTLSCPGCIVLVGARVFDGEQIRPATVALLEDRIHKVLPAGAAVSAGEIVDLSGKTILPGLIDLHVHSAMSGGPYGYQGATPSYVNTFKAALRSGVTSLLDLGTTGRVIFGFRDRIRDGGLLAPRLLAAGPVHTATGSHPCYSGTPGQGTCVFVDNAHDAGKLEAELFPHKPDVVKIIVDGGSASNPTPRLSKETIGAIVSAAKKHSVRVIAHVSRASEVQDALDSGVRLFAHMPSRDLLPQPLIDRLVQEQAVVVPTLVVLDRLVAWSHKELDLGAEGLSGEIPQEVIAALENPQYNPYAYSTEAPKMALENFRRSVEAGVRIAAGTDAGNPATFHGLALARELELYTQNGMTNIQALASATSAAADLLGRSDRGRIEEGALADLVVVDGDPSKEIGALTRVARVYLGGRLLHRESLAVDGSTSLVLVPVKEVGQDATCLLPQECGAGLFCDQWNGRCAVVCDLQKTTAGCPVGAACLAQPASATKGYCYPGDSCDLFAQQCPNKTACIWLGNGATLCWWSGAGKAGDACTAVSPCSPGFQCDYPTGICRQLCHPEDPSRSPCASPSEACVDLSPAAGLPAGICK